MLFLISSTVFADGECSLIMASTPNHPQIKVEQRAFDGVQELAIVSQDASVKSKITRLSFSGTKETGCHFPAITISKGGDWGWHVVWASSANSGIFYARVDGDAWVSSLPKRLSRDVAELLTLNEAQGKLTITAKYPAILNLPEQQYVSEDDGRNWDSVSP
jgi:hypothetical protein